MPLKRRRSLTLKVGDILTDDQLRAIATPDVARQRAGWFWHDGEEWYVCDGSHKDGTKGIKVLQRGGLR